MRVPEDVTNWLRRVFRACDERITGKLSRNPNIPEGSLDFTWIEHLSHYTAAQTLPSNWTVRIETHYLGSLRQFRGWEIADLGVLLFLRHAGRIETSKVALLQSKRLYPASGTVAEEGVTDYEVGFARLADPEDLARSIATQNVYEFTEACRYGALVSGSGQAAAIAQYEKDAKLRVYYQLYNPWRVPSTQRIPLSGPVEFDAPPELGVRVLPAPVVHRVLAKLKSGQRPQLSEFKKPTGKIPAFGWTLETFIVDEFVACREGSAFDSIGEARIQNLFYRRTGPIAAAIAISIEAPERVG